MDNQNQGEEATEQKAGNAASSQATSGKKRNCLKSIFRVNNKPVLTLTNQDLNEKLAKSYIDEADSQLKGLAIVLSVSAAVVAFLALCVKAGADYEAGSVDWAFWIFTVMATVFAILMIIITVAWFKHLSDLQLAHEAYREILSAADDRTESQPVPDVQPGNHKITVKDGSTVTIKLETK